MKQFIFNHFDTTWINHIFQYVSENLLCLVYIIDCIPEETMYFTAYFALIKDIAEGFGVWTAFIVLFLSTMLVTISIQQLLEYGFARFKFSKSQSPKLNANKLNTDTFFLKSNFFKYFNK